MKVHVALDKKIFMAAYITHICMYTYAFIHFFHDVIGLFECLII